MMQRRPDYTPTSPHEEFIVPLLKATIETHIEQALNSTHADRVRRVLDAGCGAQPFRALIERAGALYHSLDVSEQADVEVSFIARIDQTCLPEALHKAGPYNLILCSEVLEHVAEWDVAFANFYDLLSPGGRLIITCPHFFPLHEEPFDFWRPTTYAIKFFAEKHGLTVEKEEKLGTGWEVLGTLISLQRFRAHKRKFRSRVVSRLCNLARERLFGLLCSRYLQNAVMDNSPFYLANFFILRRD